MPIILKNQIVNAKKLAEEKKPEKVEEVTPVVEPTPSPESIAEEKPGMWVDVPQKAPEPAPAPKKRARTEEELLESLKASTDHLANMVVSMGGKISGEVQDVEVKWNRSVARAVRGKDGNITRVHPFKLVINKQEMPVNEEIVTLINKVLIEL